MSSSLNQAVEACTRRGFFFALEQNRGGKQAWTAYAMGDSVELGFNGALYTRAVGFGMTPDSAMIELIANLDAREAKAPKPKRKPTSAELVEELFG